MADVTWKSKIANYKHTPTIIQVLYSSVVKAYSKQTQSTIWRNSENIIAVEIYVIVNLKRTRKPEHNYRQSTCMWHMFKVDELYS